MTWLHFKISFDILRLLFFHVDSEFLLKHNAHNYHQLHLMETSISHFTFELHVKFYKELTPQLNPYFAPNLHNEQVYSNTSTFSPLCSALVFYIYFDYLS